MREVRDRLRALDQIQAPDLRERIRDWEPQAPRTEPSLRRVGIALLAFVVAAAGIVFVIQAFRATEQRPQPGAEIENGKIAFSVGADADILVVGPDGTGLTTLVDRNKRGQEGGLAIAWSSDGTKIAFTDYRPDGSRGLYVMDAEGRSPVDVSSSLADADSPTWSPDGTKLAFTGFAGTTGYEIYVVNADGTGLRRLTDEKDNGVDGAFMPAWSPDGARIAYSVTRYDENSESETQGISVMDAAGSDPVMITFSSDIDEVPVWSPDGSKIAFLRKTSSGSGVFVASSVGELPEATRLSSPGVHVTSTPSWSADSQQVVFSAQRLDNDSMGIYAATAVDADERVLLEDAYAGDPAWSPDGRWIAFVRDDAGSGLLAVWLMRKDGTDLMELAGGFEQAGGINWQALGADAEQSPDPTETPSPIALSARVAGRVRVDGVSGSVAAAEGSVWVATYDYEDRTSAVVRIDVATNQVVATVPVDGTPSNLAVGAGAVWVPTGAQPRVALLRVDATTNEVTGRVEGVHGPIVVDPTGVWAIEDGPDERDAAVVRIDPEHLRIEARIPVGESPFDMVAGAGSIWLVAFQSRGSDVETGDLLRIDATSAELAATIPIESSGIWIAADDTGVWVPAWDPDDQHDSNAYFIDASTNAVGGKLGDVYNFRPFAIEYGRVWFISGPHDRGLPDGGICGLNVTTRVVDVCAEPDWGPDLELAHDPAAFDPATHSIWVGSFNKPWVTRIDVVPAE
jgi:Tol biopolymer transport system component